MDYYRVVLPPSALKPMQRSFTSSAFLFPSKDVWGQDEVIATTADKNYTLKNLEEFFTDIGYKIGWEQYQMASPALVTEYPDIPTHCIYGLGVPTPQNFTWAKGYFPDYQPSIVYGDGDGTVNRRSLEVCKGWQNQHGEDVVSI